MERQWVVNNTKMMPGRLRSEEADLGLRVGSGMAWGREYAFPVCRWMRCLPGLKGRNGLVFIFPAGIQKFNSFRKSSVASLNKYILFYL